MSNSLTEGGTMMWQWMKSDVSCGIVVHTVAFHCWWRLPKLSSAGRDDELKSEWSNDEGGMMEEVSVGLSNAVAVLLHGSHVVVIQSCFALGQLQTERCPQTRCEQQSTTGFLWDRARRTDPLLWLWLFRLFQKEFLNAMNSQPN